MLLRFAIAQEYNLKSSGISPTFLVNYLSVNCYPLLK